MRVSPNYDMSDICPSPMPCNSGSCEQSISKNRTGSSGLYPSVEERRLKKDELGFEGACFEEDRISLFRNETKYRSIMALPLPPGLTPMEVAFLCEMEMVTVVPRQRLESLHLLGGPTQPLKPPHRAPLPLWLALLLKRQKRANIHAPPWLHPYSLESILEHETKIAPSVFSPPPPIAPSVSSSLSPPFIPSSTDSALPNHLPYHWLELGEILLEACSDDIPDPGRVRTLLRDLREVRMAKMRGSMKELEGGGVTKLTGVGGMEVAEGRGFIVGVMDGLRKLGASREAARREREEDEGDGGGGEGSEDEDMGFN
ncbi:hypothetical protein B7494_g5264 [Chlorociboria aeruginascens]|nr:hypothetical protein B7494_g5264 [Chlorociboria aeruginascens]